LSFIVTRNRTRFGGLARTAPTLRPAIEQPWSRPMLPSWRYRRLRDAIIADLDDDG
jgi:hypothetical protein